MKSEETNKHSDSTRYELLKRALLDIGPIRRGTVVRRFMRCNKMRCRCHSTPAKLHGPYYQWTRKIRGKTVTVNLGRQEATYVRRWIANGKRLDRIVTQMEKLSLRITDQLLRQLQPR